MVTSPRRAPRRYLNASNSVRNHRPAKYSPTIGVECVTYIPMLISGRMKNSTLAYASNIKVRSAVSPAACPSIAAPFHDPRSTRGLGYMRSRTSLGAARIAFGLADISLVRFSSMKLIARSSPPPLPAAGASTLRRAAMRREALPRSAGNEVGLRLKRHWCGLARLSERAARSHPLGQHYRPTEQPR